MLSSSDDVNKNRSRKDLEMKRNHFATLLAFLLFFFVSSSVYGKPQETELKSSLPTARMGITSVAVDGQIYVLGGITKQGQVSSDVDKYDTATDKWTKEATMLTPKATAFAVANLQIVRPSMASNTAVFARLRAVIGL
jgi:hypothetical protein